MSIQTLLIDHFEQGVAPAVDANDIPPGAASFSEDVDPRGMGKLRGRAGERAHPVTPLIRPEHGHGPVSGVLGQRPNENRPVIYQDVGGGPGVSFIEGGLFPGRLGFGMGSHHESFVRPLTTTGGLQPLPPLWAGFVRHGQFQSDPPESSTLADIFFEQSCVGINTTPETPGEYPPGFPYMPPAPAPVHIPGTERLFLERYEEFDLPASYVDPQNHEVALQDKRTYIYRASLVYDGYQESDLSGNIRFDLPGASGMIGDEKIIRFKVAIPASPASKRISAIRLYRAEYVWEGEAPPLGSNGRGTSITPDTPYRFIREIPLSANGWDLDNGFRKFVVRDGYVAGETFSQSAGFPETMRAPFMLYKMCCEEAERLFVAGCKHPELKGEPLERRVYASLPYRYGVFDWTQDYLTLDSEVVAMHAWGNRVWVGTRARLYRINPWNMSIEEDFPLEVVGPHALSSGPSGLFAITRRGFYISDGARIARVSETIETSEDDIGWQEVDPARNVVGEGYPIALYHEPLAAYLSIFRHAPNDWRCWAFRPTDSRWDYLRLDIGDGNTIRGGFQDANGRAWVAVQREDATTFLASILDDEEGRLPWTWRSGRMRLTPGAEATFSKLYRLVATGNTQGLTARARLEDGQWIELPRPETLTDQFTFSLAALTTEEPQEEPELSTEERRPRSRIVQIELSGEPATEIRSLTVVHRPLTTRGRLVRAS